MKNLTLSATIIAASMLFSACDPQPPRKKPAAGGMREPAPEAVTETKPKKEKKEEEVTPAEANPVIETPKHDAKPVPPPTPNPEYGKKTEGKPGFIESPYSPGKLIDVRGLPPGTEIECPYTRRPLLVP